MIHAYDENYLETARRNLGLMLEYGVYVLGKSLDEFWKMFLQTEWSSRFAAGDCRTVAGMSGIELAECVAEDMGENLPEEDHDVYDYYEHTSGRSREYWTGWSLAYYQWQNGRSFQDIECTQPITEICLLYEPYHEMDIQQFTDRMEAWYNALCSSCNLKRRRTECKMSQSQLASLAGVPVRTIQQYEQRQKDINMCHAETIVRLAHALCCRPADLLE